ncbi:MAG: flavin reductase [Microthrixaceae bacterium]
MASSHPDVLGPGRDGWCPVYPRFALPGASVVAVVADGMSNEEILFEHPDLEPEDITESLSVRDACCTDRLDEIRCQHPTPRRAMSAQRLFDTFVRHADHSMLIVTAESRSDRGGCLVGFHSQVSIEPPRYAVCLSKANHTFGVAREAHTLGVHLLGADRTDLAEAFGGQTDDDRADKFHRFGWWSHSESGTPILAGVADWFVGAIGLRIDVGDHVVFVLDPVAGETSRSGDVEPLRFLSATSTDPGHSP